MGRNWIEQLLQDLRFSVRVLASWGDVSLLVRGPAGDQPAVKRLIASVNRDTLVCMGLVWGLICALFLTRGLAGLLFSVQASDPSSFIAVALLFAVIALLGCYVPAQRAAKIDPNIALRYE